MQTYNFLNSIFQKVEQHVQGRMRPVEPSKLGLDPRSARHLYIDNDGWIAVPIKEDGTLQYYGGFEYVEKHARYAMGAWVFYSSEDSRVAKAIGFMNNAQGNEEQINADDAFDIIEAQGGEQVSTTSNGISYVFNGKQYLLPFISGTEHSSPRFVNMDELEQHLDNMEQPR